MPLGRQKLRKEDCKFKVSLDLYKKTLPPNEVGGGGGAGGDFIM